MDLFVPLVILMFGFRHLPGCIIKYARDCQDIKDLGFIYSGIYHVIPTGLYKGFYVYCDMDEDGGGWLVFQRRQDGSVDFLRDWNEYELGFGDLDGEHWLGNLLLHVILLQGHYELRVDLEDWDGNKTFANYWYFNVAGPGERYQMTVAGYYGRAGDALGNYSGSAFSTKDKDNDSGDNFDCANAYNGSWWYAFCHRSNLNGLYLRGHHTSFANGVNWIPFRGYHYSLKRTEMKVRRV